MTDQDRLSRVICVCTGNHDPERRIECRYALDAATKTLTSGWLRDLLAEAKADALREAADDWGRNSTVTLWLRARANNLANPYRETSTGGRDE